MRGKEKKKTKNKNKKKKKKKQKKKKKKKETEERNRRRRDTLNQRPTHLVHLVREPIASHSAPGAQVLRDM